MKYNCDFSIEHWEPAHFRFTQKWLVKLTPDVNFIDIWWSAFSPIFFEKHCGEKALVKCSIKLTPALYAANRQSWSVSYCHAPSLHSNKITSTSETTTNSFRIHSFIHIFIHFHSFIRLYFMHLLLATTLLMSREKIKSLVKFSVT